MAERTVRALEAPALVASDESRRLVHARPVIAIAAETDREAAFSALGVGGAGVAHLRLALRQSPGHRLADGTLYAHPEDADAALRETLAALGPHELLVAEGPLAIDRLRAAIAIAIVPGPSSLSWSRDLRAVRHRIDLLLFEARPQLLGHLSRSVLGTLAR